MSLTRLELRADVAVMVVAEHPIKSLPCGEQYVPLSLLSLSSKEPSQTADFVHSHPIPSLISRDEGEKEPFTFYTLHHWRL